jgi:predicted transport protein
MLTSHSFEYFLDCDPHILKSYMICLSENDLYVSFRSTRNFMKIAKTLIQLKTAIVLFVDDINANTYTYFFNEEVSEVFRRD